MFARFVADPVQALPLVERCRRREEYARIILQPGADRGTAL
ncbi:MAG: hypothetical protein OZ935_06430 [Pseudomonadota bacterium]|jgi:hypothetical protein|nr:hypothetical protein [Pseudomonadota bacterium]